MQKNSENLNSSFEDLVKNLNQFLTLNNRADVKQLLKSYENFDNEVDKMYELIVS